MLDQYHCCNLAGYIIFPAYWQAEWNLVGLLAFHLSWNWNSRINRKCGMKRKAAQVFDMRGPCKQNVGFRFKSKPVFHKLRTYPCTSCCHAGSFSCQILMVDCFHVRCRSCPKAYHMECTGRESEFFRKKGQWLCGMLIITWCTSCLMRKLCIWWL